MSSAEVLEGGEITKGQKTWRENEGGTGSERQQGEAPGSQGAKRRQQREQPFTQSSCFGALRQHGSKRPKTPRSTKNLRKQPVRGNQDFYTT